MKYSFSQYKSPPMGVSSTDSLKLPLPPMVLDTIDFFRNLGPHISPTPCQQQITLEDLRQDYLNYLRSVSESPHLPNMTGIIT